MGKPKKNDSIHLTSRETLPYFRSVNVLAIVARFMENLGIDTETLLEGSGIRTEDLDDPDVFVTPEQELQVMRKIVTLSRNPKIGLVIGRMFHVGLYGKLGPAIISSDTVLDALEIGFKYIALTLSYFQYDLRVKGDLAFMRMKELIDLKDLRIFICEREFSSLYRNTSDIIHSAIPLNEVRIAYPRPAHAAAYDEVFQCPVSFDTDEHMVIFDSRYLFMPLPLANPLARKTYERECKQACLRLRKHETIRERVRHNIQQQHEGLPSFGKLVQNMNIAPRTLKRRLHEEGTSYRALAADILKEKAIQLIRTTSMPLEEIAVELGYTAPQNFYRAFKCWTGHTPSYYREKK